MHSVSLNHGPNAADVGSFPIRASLTSHIVAYVESTPGLPIRSRSKDFLFSHVQAALAAIREALSKPDVATDDSICLAVVLLMLTAVRLPCFLIVFGSC